MMGYAADHGAHTVLGLRSVLCSCHGCTVLIRDTFGFEPLERPVAACEEVGGGRG